MYCSAELCTQMSLEMYVIADDVYGANDVDQ